MTTARSVHIGLNSVDSSSYRGWSGQLHGCENDARAMQLLALPVGFTPRLILTAEATRDTVLAEFERAAQVLVAGDLYVITFSGHGASFTITDGSIDEDGGRDEAWCLYDGYLLDDELHAQMTKFAPGVRVLVVSDSCFSGTVTRVLDLTTVRTLIAPRGIRDGAPRADADRRMPREIAQDVLESRRRDYERMKAAVAALLGCIPAASILLLAACQDDQSATEIGAHGLFTTALVTVWDRGAFVGSHREFLNAIRRLLPATQVPNLFATGTARPDFEASRPFTP